jgi:uncharacterized PurR-regulated membrane protein YhhQ (DUF165 family)
MLIGSAYLASILLANILVITFGIIHIGPLHFPAGAIVIGFTFTLRDFVQLRWGKAGCWWWMLGACLITLALNWQIALASSAAFLVGEGVDWLVFTFTDRPIHERMILSNLFGTPLDSAVFVAIAFGFQWQFVWGQTLVKFASSVLVIPLIAYLRGRHALSGA